MIAIPGFTIETQFHAGSKRIYYRGTRKSDNRSVIIKISHPDHFDDNCLAQMSNEYQYARHLKIKGIPKYFGLEKYKNGIALIMEDVKSLPLRNLLNQNKLGLVDFLNISIKLSVTIGNLHRHDIIHNDLNPNNIFVNLETKQAWIMDFGMASFVLVDKHSTINKQLSERDLEYISPEQTGRMSCPVDYRTDFYSLGVILYECITGKLPFNKTDPLILVYYHLAKRPLPPMEIDSKIPKSVSDIIIRLLAKTADGRYQSAFGLMHDLEECLMLFNKNNDIPPFELGLRDISEKFLISQKKYGRETEQKICMQITEQVWQGGMECIVVSGYAGIGKTSFVHQMNMLLAQKSGFFVSGKFDQYHRNIPYRAFTDSFKALIRQIMTKDESFLEKITKELFEVLGQNGRIITDLIPDVEVLIGPQPSLKELVSEDTRNWFNRIFKKFIQVFCKKEHPLVVFFDDIQWIDAASLNLLEAIISDENIKYLLLVFAYRDNEVPKTHSLMPLLKKIETKFDKINHICLPPLKQPHVSKLIADTLKIENDGVEPLADLLIQKTNGNPFFINQFLATLHHDRFLIFDTAERCWKWDLSNIQKQRITDNVVDLLIHRLKQLSSETRHTLAIAACIGSQFDLKTLSFLMDSKLTDISRIFIQAVEQDLLKPLSNLDDLDGNELIEAYQPDTYQFQHDRIQQAAYALLTDHQRKTIHLNIGRFLIKEYDETVLEANVFDIVHHLNAAIDCMDNTKELEELARLNLRAGKKASLTTAYETALEYFKIGIDLVGETGWQAKPDLTLELYCECIESARLKGEYVLMKALIETTLKHTSSALEQVRVYKSRIQRCIAENDLVMALETALLILSKLNIYIPENPSTAVIKDTLDSTMMQIKGRHIDDLIKIKKMKDSEKLAAMSILATVTSAAYIGAPELFPLIVCKGVDLSIHYGNTSESAMAYASFGVILCKRMDDIDSGYKLGQLSLKLVKIMDANEHEAKVYHATTCYILHWKEHIRDTFGHTLLGYQSGLETGDFEFAGYGVYCHSMHSFLSGRKLNRVEQDMHRYGLAIKQLRQETPFRYNEIFHQTVLNLISAGENEPCHLGGDTYEETLMLPVHKKANDRLAILFYYFCKLFLNYLFGEYDKAIKYAMFAEKELRRAAGGPFILPGFIFYDSLVRLALCRKCNDTKVKKTHCEKIANNQVYLKKWSNAAPMNHLHKYHLVQAELAGLAGDVENAVKNYDLAIDLALKYQYRNEAAVAYELMGNFWMDRKMKSSGNICLQKAYDTYSDWGAFRKCVQMNDNYPQISLKTILLESPSLPRQPNYGVMQDKKQSIGLDLMTMIKASQAISHEIELDKLLTKLMRFVIENVGAQRGALLLHSNGRFVTGAYGSAKGYSIVVNPFLPGKEKKSIPLGIVKYVMRTRELLILNGEDGDDLFPKDLYLKTFKPKSVLCMPLLHKSSLIGVLYLENRLASGVFSYDRSEVLKLLGAQIAISIVNSKLYEELRKAEEKYRSIFENAAEGIFQTSPEGRFITTNPAMAKILGYKSVEDLMGSITDIGKQLYVSMNARDEFITKIRRNHELSGFEVEFRRKDGSRIWASLHARTVNNRDGTIKFIEGIFSDITEQKRMTQALRESEAILRKENLRLKSNIKDRYRFGKIIGKSSSMQEVYELLLKAAGSNENVIVYGESGTGKELVARAIHDASERKQKPFVTVHCGAIPSHLFESEFFGYTKGAFTGAERDKTGLFYHAACGTLFLDELGEIDQSNQVKLLRVLEGGGYTPIGGHKVLHPNARIIAATNKNLRRQIDKGLMREDFFYRIHVIPIHLPPLKDRMEDIPLLIEHFMKIHDKDKKSQPMSGEMLEAILQYNWPGNVRELRNVLHRYITLGQFDLKTKVKTTVQPYKSDSDAILDGTIISYQAAMDNFEKRLFLKVLDKYQWHRGNTAEKLGIPRRTFFRKIKKMGIIRQK